MKITVDGIVDTLTVEGGGSPKKHPQRNETKPAETLEFMEDGGRDA